MLCSVALTNIKTKGMNMSIEDAILEHAGALRELAAAIRSLTGQMDGAVVAGQVRNEKAASQVDESMGKPSKPAAERVAATKEAAAQDAKANEAKKPESGDQKASSEKPAGNGAVSSDAELDKTVEQVEQKALEYKADVYPVLIQVSKKSKDKLRELLTKYDAKTGDTLASKHFAAIVADANAYLAA
jgi:hypothetical protein